MCELGATHMNDTTNSKHKRYDEAFAAYDKALALKPDLENAWLGRGNVFCDLKRYDEAFAAMTRHYH